MGTVATHACYQLATEVDNHLLSVAGGTKLMFILQLSSICWKLMHHRGIQIGPYAAFSLYQQWHRRLSFYKMSTTPCYQMLILDDASVVAALLG